MHEALNIINYQLSIITMKVDLMKKLSILLILVLLLSLTACAAQPSAQVAATTMPVYCFTARLCRGTPITVERLVTESVSCLHDYTLQVDQMRAIENAELLVISGAGLEEFLEDALRDVNELCDASEGLSLIEGEHHEHEHDHDHDHGHSHSEDPHIWLSPVNAKAMASNICHALEHEYPEYSEFFHKNLTSLLTELDALQSYGEAALADLRARELITFHDGFSYLAESFDLTILKAIEEESGSEAAASDLIQLIGMVEAHSLPAVFTEVSGSDAAASIIAAETGVKVYALDMAMSGDDYFEAMYYNIDILKEALG